VGVKQFELDVATPKTERSFLFDNDAPSETTERVAQYFQTSGFSRWTAIYGEGRIPPIWRVIRDGHDQAMAQVIEWIADDGTRTALDAGCGTGALSLKLAENGCRVDAFDVSAPMISFARYNTKDRSRGTAPNFYVGDIAGLKEAPHSYDLVCCLDVLFHYPYADVRKMLENLIAISSNKVIGSFALRTPFNAFWMMIGKRFFHQKNRMTNLYLLSYDDVEQIFYRAGFKLTRTHRVKRFFYDSCLFEAVRRK
jgi:magnesium-protoporphyrin O-methyltransferase